MKKSGAACRTIRERRESMSTFVLVHGAWGGSFGWRKVRRLLSAQGNEVFTPSLTGIGERAHLVSPQVRLQTVPCNAASAARCGPKSTRGTHETGKRFTAEPGAAADRGRVIGFWDFKLTYAAPAAELGR